jgi:predicted HTH domain antitoxin
LGISSNKIHQKEDATMSLHISDATLKTLCMTEEELALEITLMLYQQKRLSLRQVMAMTGLTIFQVQCLLSKRSIPLQADAAFAGSLSA